MEKNNLIIIKDVCIFDGISIKKNKNVIFSKDKIIAVMNASSPLKSGLNSARVIEGGGHLLVPGFIDIQVNGGGGCFFNREPTAKALKTIFQAHLKFGTTGIFPTVISDSLNTLKKCIQVVEQNQQNHQNSNSGILGLHIEGPLINKEKKGIHRDTFLLPSSQSDAILKILSTIKIQKCLVTLAPEKVDATIIKKLVKKGHYIFAGHTNASAELMTKSFAHGVSGVTHLFNACSQITARDVGVVGASLLKKNILCSVIADGVHISWDALKIAFKVKDLHDFILVSDAMESVGTNLKSFSLFNDIISVNKKTLKNAEGTLAGAHLTMLWAFQNLMQKKLVTLEEAICMTSTNQAKHFGFTCKGAILPGYDAHAVLLDKNRFNLLKVIFSGEVL